MKMTLGCTQRATVNSALTWGREGGRRGDGGATVWIISVETLLSVHTTTPHPHRRTHHFLALPDPLAGQTAARDGEESRLRGEGGGSHEVWRRGGVGRCARRHGGEVHEGDSIGSTSKVEKVGGCIHRLPPVPPFPSVPPPFPLRLTLMLEAMAFPMRVLPVPGGPKRSRPRGGDRAP